MYPGAASGPVRYNLISPVLWRTMSRRRSLIPQDAMLSPPHGELAYRGSRLVASNPDGEEVVN